MKNVLETMTDSVDIETTEKVKKLKLSPYQLIVVDSIDVTIQVFDVPAKFPDDVIRRGYGAVLVLHVSSDKKQEFPITMQLPIAGECYIRVAIDALAVACGMCDDVGDQISVFFGDDEILVIDADDMSVRPA